MFIGCTPNEDPTTVPYWVDQLDDRRTRTDAIHELGKLGKKEALPELIHWLQQEGDWQPAAAYAIGQIKDASASQVLIEQIDFSAGGKSDRASLNRNKTNINIARALVMIKSPQAAAPLLRLLDGGDAKVREAVMQALGHLGDAAAIEALTSVTQDDPEPFLRKVAVQALGDLGAPEGVPALVQMLYREMPGVSFYADARFALIQVGSAAVPLLLQTIDRKNEAVEALRLPDGAPFTPGAIEAKAASVLGALRAKEAEERIIAALKKYHKLLPKPDAPTYPGIAGAVIELCYALGDLGGSTAVAALLPLVSATDPSVRLGVTEALTTIGDRSVVDTLLAAAKTGDVTAKKATLVAASRLGGKAHLQSFDALAQGDLAELARNARPRLEAAADCETNTACWTKKLTDPNAVVRERAAYELGWQAAAGGTPALLKAAEDDDAQVRMAAVLSLWRHDDVDRAKLQAILGAWETKIEYAGVNRELKRLIASLSRKR